MPPIDENPIAIDLSHLERPNSVIIIDDEEEYRQRMSQIVLRTIPSANLIVTNCHNQVVAAIGHLITNPQLVPNILGTIFDRDGLGYRQFGEGPSAIIMPVPEDQSGITLAQIMSPIHQKPPVILVSSFIELAVNAESVVQALIRKSELDKLLPETIERLFLPRYMNT